MRNNRGRQTYVLTFAVLIASIAATCGPAAAGWLVTNDNARIETKGPWKIEDLAVVFTLANGSLYSLPLSEVDLDASAAASSETGIATAGYGSEPAARKPALVLTNDDVPRAASGRPLRAGHPRAGGARCGAKLEVGLWAEAERPDISGLEIVGLLRNESQLQAQAVAVFVELVDKASARTATVRAELESRLLRPGETTRFRATFIGVGEDRGRPSFKVECTALNVAGTD